MKSHMTLLSQSYVRMKSHTRCLENREPLTIRPGDTQKLDFEYIRNGICSIFVFVESLAGIRYVSVREHCTEFPASETRRIVKKLEFHYTPKHGN